jgi:hypothetical protein
VRDRSVKTGLLVQLVLASFGMWAVSASAEPASGPHETLDQRWTTTQPNAPAGWSFTGKYHAAGDPDAPPPYMRKMTFYPPPGTRYDTSVPEKCTASDIELHAFGPDACPAASRLGGGTTTTSFMERFPSTLDIDVFNDTDEMVMLARSPGLTTVMRGRMHPDGSTEYASPTCFPSVQPVGCPVDDVLQLESAVSAPPYTRSVDGSVRSYLTTPPKCPKAGHWQGTVRLWWADGSVDTVATEQPCTRPAAKPRPARKHGKKRRR